MEKETIKEGNVIIAKFMGGETYIPRWEMQEGTNRVHWSVPKGTSGFHVALKDSLYYHSSWDWLMPVVEKINWILIGNVKDGSFRLEGKIKEALYPPDIKAVWLAVVEFIQWYNTQPQ